MTDPTQVSLHTPPHARTQAYTVCLGDVSLYFSYQTCIAFRAGAHRYRLENHWGPTTGKHLSLLGVRDFEVLPDEDFAKLLHLRLGIS